jgi:hypothetical protein
VSERRGVSLSGSTWRSAVSSGAYFPHHLDVSQILGASRGSFVGPQGFKIKKRQTNSFYHLNHPFVPTGSKRNSRQSGENVNPIGGTAQLDDLMRALEVGRPGPGKTKSIKDLLHPLGVLRAAFNPEVHIPRVSGATVGGQSRRADHQS